MKLPRRVAQAWQGVGNNARLGSVELFADDGEWKGGRVALADASIKNKYDIKFLRKFPPTHIFSQVMESYWGFNSRNYRAVRDQRGTW